MISVSAISDVKCADFLVVLIAECKSKVEANLVDKKALKVWIKSQLYISGKRLALIRAQHSNSLGLNVQILSNLPKIGVILINRHF